MRILYLSTPSFGISPLENLVKSHHQVIGVVTQPDRTHGRGNKIVFSPIKEKAIELGLPIYQFEKIKENIDFLKTLNADVFLTCAYGQILTQQVLDIPKYGVINIHASLLPRYRGSAPVARAIQNGDQEIGVTFMQTALKVDSGAMIDKVSGYFTDENTEETLDILSHLAGEKIAEVLDTIENGTAVFTPQDETLSTYQPMINKEDGILNFGVSREDFVNFVRAMTPWPSAYFQSKFGRIKVLKASSTDLEKDGEIGTVYSGEKALLVNVQDGVVRLDRIQADGGKPMDDSAFLLGRKFTKGEKIISE